MIVSIVSGRELVTASVLAMSICRDSSSRLWTCACNNDASIPLAEWIWRSHIPTMLIAAGGFLFHFIKSARLLWRNVYIFVWSTSLNALINSCSAPSKFDPLWGRICPTFSLFAIRVKGAASSNLSFGNPAIIWTSTFPLSLRQVA